MVVTTGHEHGRWRSGEEPDDDALKLAPGAAHARTAGDGGLPTVVEQVRTSPGRRGGWTSMLRVRVKARGTTTSVPVNSGARAPPQPTDSSICARTAQVGVIGRPEASVGQDGSTSFADRVRGLPCMSVFPVSPVGVATGGHLRRRSPVGGGRSRPGPLTCARAMPYQMHRTMSSPGDTVRIMPGPRRSPGSRHGGRRCDQGEAGPCLARSPLARSLAGTAWCPRRCTMRRGRITRVGDLEQDERWRPLRPRRIRSVTSRRHAAQLRHDLKDENAPIDTT